jgi:hypothetical protein
MATQRKLAAIVLAEIAGGSPHVSEDEATRLKRRRRRAFP